MSVLSAGRRGGPSYGPALVAGLIGLAATLVVILVPGLRFAYESLELHVALESAQGVVGLLLCYVFFGRMRATMRLRHLLLTVAFAAFAATNLFVSALPVALEGETVGYAAWLAAMLRLLAAGALAAAALWPDRTVALDGLASRMATVTVVAAATVILAAAVADSSFAELVDPRLSPEASSRPLIAGHPVAVAIQIASTLAMAVAAWAFVGLARRTGDDLFRWLGAGATLGAFARLNYVLFPSLYTEWFYTGDLLRFGSYLLFLTGAARELELYWRSHAQVAVMDERQRVARELHDGLTQELSFIRSQLSVDPDRPPSTAALRFVSEAAGRALDESRKMIVALADDEGSESLADRLRRAAEVVAVRQGVRVVIDGGTDAPVADETQTALERIVREAAVNAVRHGHPSLIEVRTATIGSSLVVTVTDDGAGFDPGSAPDGGFGLRSMRQRAEALGGTLEVESAPGSGTTVRAVVGLDRAT
jgi:signal transduction histidine kinase